MYTCICVYRFRWSRPSVLRRGGVEHLLLSYQLSLAFVPVIDIHPHESYNNTFVLCMLYKSPCAMCADDGTWKIPCGDKSVVITSLRWVHHFCPPLLVSVSHSLIHPSFLDSRLAHLACLSIRINNSDVLGFPRLAHREYCKYFCHNLLKYFLKSTLEVVVCSERVQQL